MAACSIVIPTLNAADLLPELIAGLHAQSLPPKEIIVIDSASTDGTVGQARELGCIVEIIPRCEFDHGGTRQRAVERVHGEIVIFLTQDVLPAGSDCLEELVRFFNDPSIGAVCGRQLPKQDANPLAAHARLFNYPCDSHVRTKKDIPGMGIKVPFVSNSFTAYRKSVLQSVGGFPDHIILGEDMLVAARMILAGYAIGYAGDARVYHSHNYTLRQELKRYFDIGVFHARNQWIQSSFGRPGGEGKRYASSELLYVRKRGMGWILRSLASTFFKYVGYTLGKNESRLPRSCKLLLTMNKGFWN
jgi:rhamnosyltransferase